MRADDCSGELHPEALKGLEFFNAGEYFEAHEALESAWRAETGQIRGLYQGILQAAVTYLHIQRGNFDGALKVSARAQVRLRSWPDRCRGVDVAALRDDLTNIMTTITRLGPAQISAFDQSQFKPVRYDS